MDQAEREKSEGGSGKARQIEGVFLLDKTTGQVLRNGAPSPENGPRMGTRDEFSLFTAIDHSPGWSDTNIMRLDRKSLLWRETASYVDPLDGEIVGGPIAGHVQGGKILHLQTHPHTTHTQF